MNSNRDKIIETITKTEDDFEKKITQVSAGALALSITFIDRIVDLSQASNYWILIIGWLLLAITLFVNLFNILYSRDQNLKIFDDYDENEPENNLDTEIKKKNKIITRIDKFSLGTLITGISFIIIFSSINLFNLKSNTTMEKKEKIQEGRTIIRPTNNPPKKQNEPKSNDNDKKE